MRRYLLAAAAAAALATQAADAARAEPVPQAPPPAPAPAPAPAEEPIVVGIEFRGNKRTSGDTLRLSLRTKENQRLDPALLPDDVNTLLLSFQSVDLKVETTPQGVRLIFTVVESAPVVSVEVSGNSGLSTTDVSAVVETAAGRPLAEFRVENDRRKIERLYRTKGFHFVQVTPRIEPLGDGRRVTFEIFEGPQVEIDEIEFSGNKAFPKDKLLDRAVMRETGLLGLLPGYYVEESVRQDLLSIRTFYRSEGWLDAQVELGPIDYSADRSEATVHVRVTEGPAYTFGDVKIEGVRSFPGGPEALLKLLAIQKGERKRQDKITRSIEAIERAYREEGFYAAVVSPDERLRPTEQVVDVVFRVDEASKVKVRTLAIAGNVVTQDKVIRREIPLAPGDVLNQNAIDKGKRKLQGLGYFERVSARIEAPVEGEDPNQRDVIFEVDDTANTGSIRFGVGVSSDRGVSATINLTKRNFDWKDWPERFGDVLAGKAFTGAGQTFQLELSPGNDYSSYRVGFTEPWMFDKPIIFGWDVHLNQFRRFEYDQDTRGISFFLGRRWVWEGRDRDTVFGVQARTRLESMDVDGIDEDSTPTAFLAEGSNSLIAEELTFRLHRLDNEASPSDGWYSQVSTELGVGGDIQLWKNSVEAKRFWTVYRDLDERPHIFTVGARLAVAQPVGSSVEPEASLFDESDYVPIYEGYFAGGSSTIRGFSYGGAGPHGQGDPFLARRSGESAQERNARLREVVGTILDNHGDPMGGNVQFVTSAEYSLPLFEDMLRGVFFCDAGSVRSSFSSTHGLDEDDALRYLPKGVTFDDGDSFFSDFRVAVGFGLRIRIPALGPVPLALDLGFPIKEQDGDDTQVISFSVERRF